MALQQDKGQVQVLDTDGGTLGDEELISLNITASDGQGHQTVSTVYKGQRLSQESAKLLKKYRE